MRIVDGMKKLSCDMKSSVQEKTTQKQELYLWGKAIGRYKAAKDQES